MGIDLYIFQEHLGLRHFALQQFVNTALFSYSIYIYINVYSIYIFIIFGSYGDDAHRCISCVRAESRESTSTKLLYYRWKYYVDMIPKCQWQEELQASYFVEK